MSTFLRYFCCNITWHVEAGSGWSEWIVNALRLPENHFFWQLEGYELKTDFTPELFAAIGTIHSVRNDVHELCSPK